MSRDRLLCGADGEAIAAAFLRARGYTIVTNNFRCAVGEIDLIALDGETLVFCEVRTRRSAGQGSALESVTARKQRQVVRVANFYLSRQQLHAHAVRFDVVAIEMRGGDVAIEHVVDAFRAE